MPGAGGIRLPAEWEPQSGVMLTWPHEDSDWADNLDRVLPVFAEIGAQIAAHEQLLSVCRSHRHVADIRSRLVTRGADPGRLLFAVAPSNDTWARDHGPLATLRDGYPELNDYVFNGWGGKFAAEMDSAINGRLHDHGLFGPVPLNKWRLVLEGGAIETDGAGTLLATRSSVVSANRNPGLDVPAIERLLTDQLGLMRFLWLRHGDISGDDTDGHIDTLARFADPRTILYATAPAGDQDHAELSAMEAELRALRTADGRRYRLLPLPFPGMHRDGDGRRLPATYANFLIINGAVLLPVYGVAEDKMARDVLQTAFPGREIIPIDCREIIRQNGSLHCLTMQFPSRLEFAPTPEYFVA